MKPSHILRSFLLAAGSSLLAISFASAQTPLVATGSSPALSVTASNSTNYSITGTTEQNSYNGVIRNTSGNNTLSGNIILNSPTGGIRFDTSGGNLIFSGNISQTGTSQAFGLAPASGTTITVNNAINNNGGTFQTLASGANGTAGTTILAGVSGSGIGATNVAQNSTLQLGITNALNTTANLNIAAFGGTDQGTFNLNGFNQTVNALTSSATGTNRIVRNNSATTASTLTVGNGNGNGSFNGTIVNGAAATLALVKTGSGNQTLSGINTFTGGTTISGGTLTLGHATNTLANGGAINVNGGTLALGTNSDTVGAVTLTSGSITGSTGVLTGSSYGVQSGSVSAILGGSGVGLTKSTSGTVTLTNTNTYSGATQINAGTLAVNGSGSINNSSVTVNGGTFLYNSSVAYSGTLTFTSGTIAGTNLNGTLGGQTIGTGKTISPGNSPGTMATTGQTWAADGSYLWEINDATGTVGSDPGWDLLSGTGTLNITSSSSDPFDILVTSLTLGNLPGDAANFSDLLDYNWMIADFASITGFDETDFFVNTAAFDNPFTGTFGISLGGVGAVPGDNSQIYLTYTAIPEPSAALLGGLGLLALLRRRR